MRGIPRFHRQCWSGYRLVELQYAFDIVGILGSKLELELFFYLYLRWNVV